MKQELKVKIETAIVRIRQAADLHPNRVAIVGLFSGGHDSATANIIAHEAGADLSLHINTGIGIPQTREYVEETCTREDWKLREYKAVENTLEDGTPDPQIYEEIVMKNGFPGAFAHGAMYVKLKERQLARFERDLGATTKRPLIYVSGCRSDESTRRMGTVEEYQKQGRRVWVAPIHDFTKSDCGNCMAMCGVARNEVVDLLHKSGECLCGAFAKPGEFSEIKYWFPEVGKRIESLEKEIADKWPWKWEDNGPPEWFRQKQQGQSFMLDYDQSIQSQPLCRKCNLEARATMKTP